MLGVAPCLFVRGDELFNGLVPCHAARFLEPLARPVSVTGRDGVLSGLHERSRVCGRPTGRRQRDGRERPQAHVAPSPSHGEAIDPTPRVRGRDLQIEPAAVVQEAGRLGAHDGSG